MKFFTRKKKRTAYGWFGDYISWQQAAQDSHGYAADNILEKTKTALLKIKKGEAVYERDSVIFDKKQYPFPVISALLYIATTRSNQLNVIDFGGSLGSTWFQVRDFLTALSLITWNVVEQKEYVTCGKGLFEDEELKFHYSIEECINLQRPDVILLSSVIQYLDKPHDFLQSLIDYNVEYILIDRTAFIKSGNDRLTRQIVPPQIYEATYPTWFFNEKNFLSHFMSKYEIMAEFPSYVEGEEVLHIDNQPLGYDKGFLLKRI